MNCSGKKRKLPEFEAPSTSDDIQRQVIQSLLTKQTDTKTSLSLELSNQKEFIKPNDSIPLQKINETAVFQRHNLTKEEIDLYEGLKRGDIVNKHNPDIQLKVSSILNKLKHNQDETFALHPKEQIKEIEQTLMESVSLSILNTSVHQIRKKARKLHNRAYNIKTTDVKGKSASTSKWDLKEYTEELKPVSVPIIDKKTYTCSKKKLFTIKEGEIIPIDKAQNVEISTQKLSVDEIKKLKNFEQYEVGALNNVLYLKNLPNKLEKLHIYKLFKSFCDSITDVRLMHGKMKGQAFVTFKDESSAKDALENTSGTLINSRPVIIQFGKIKK